jgi:amidohydrolase
VHGTVAFTDSWVADHEPELVEFRRDLHAHPELGRAEFRTTRVIADRLAAGGLRPRVLPGDRGVWADIRPGGPAGPEADVAEAGDGEDRPDVPVIMVRADIDALPLTDPKDVPYASTVPGVCHACGHDAHTSAVLGAGLALAEAARRQPLPGTVRLVFQPAEEVMPGGSRDVIDAGVLKPVSGAITLHCDPTLDVGTVGLRVGPVTAAADSVRATLAGPGGHTSRPQNTVDLIYALGQLVVELPAALSRLVDPRAALSLVWGQIEAGTVANAIPRAGSARGTVRTLSRETWEVAPALVSRLAAQIVAPYGAEISVDYIRGVPPVVNTAEVVESFRLAVADTLGIGAEVGVVQSLGGEDFGWYLEHVPGALARLGTRVPGGATHDLHQPAFDIDERAIGIGARLMAAAAVENLARLAATRA